MSKKVSNLYMGLVFALLYLPIMVVILYSFNDAKSILWKGFTFRWYAELFRDEAIMRSLANTLLVAVISAIVSTILGTMAVIGIHNLKKRTRTLVLNTSYLPIINPEIVTGVSLMLLFSFLGVLLGFEMGMGTVILAHISFSVPYVILNVLPKLRQMNKHIYEAALDLGCRPMRAFFKVVLPEIFPGVLSGFLMAFTFSLDDFIITYFVRGATFQTLPIEIYSMLRRRISPKINALSALLFVTVLIALILVHVKDYRKKEKPQRV